MPQMRFYNTMTKVKDDKAGTEALVVNPSHKALGFETFSPEEAQEYEKALAVDIPEGSRLVVRRRNMPKTGRTELIIGVTQIGEPLVLEGEQAGDPQPNPPAPVMRALDIPPNVVKASDAELEVMAATNGITVDDKWRRKNRAIRNSDVARRLKEKKEAVTA